jgi:FkbM family methyltransferase
VGEHAVKLLQPLRVLRRLFQPAPGKVSYAQCGEDLIVDYLLTALGIERPTYLDIGAHHPTFLSNTYYFYRKGCRGVLVEADPTLIPALKRTRPRDVCVSAGVARESNGAMPFYVMQSTSLSTFSGSDAKRVAAFPDHKIERVIQVPVLSLAELIRRYCPEMPHFVSLDVEGMDLTVLQGMDFTRFRPPVFCIETLTYTPDKTEWKVTEIIELMHGVGYLSYADTYINTIFVDEGAWNGR